MLRHTLNPKPLFSTGWGCVPASRDSSNPKPLNPKWVVVKIRVLLGTLNSRCRIILGTQKGTMVLTTTQLCPLNPKPLNPLPPKPYRSLIDPFKERSKEPFLEPCKEPFSSNPKTRRPRHPACSAAARHWRCFGPEAHWAPTGSWARPGLKKLLSFRALGL